eukprot:1798277-Amphidinium_carterae.1
MKVVIEDLLKSGEWTDSQASSLAGRLNFMRTFIAGRPLRAVLQIVFAKATRQGRSTITDEERAKRRACLTLIREYLGCAKPRLVGFSSCLPPLVLYTDGAVEQGVAIAGAVLHVPGKSHQWFQLE